MPLSSTEVVNTFLGLDDNTDTALLHSTLSKLYITCIEKGIEPSLLLKIIPFVCHCEFISVQTLVYIIEHCILPRSYVPSQVVIVIIKHLGPQTPQNPYKFVTPPAIQVALCRWLCHVYPFIQDVENVFQKTYSLWFQLWLVDYLQDWVTYLLFWSTSRRSQITPYRIKVLMQVGQNPGYMNSRAFASFLLNKFSQLDPRDDVLDAQEQLKCNATKLASVGKLPVDVKFYDKLGAILAKAGQFEYDLFISVTNNHVKKLSSATLIPSINIELNSLQHLVNEIEKFGAPSDYFSTLDGTGYKRLLLPLMPPAFRSSFHLWARSTLKKVGNNSKRFLDMMRLFLVIGETDITFEDLLMEENTSTMDEVSKSLYLLCLMPVIDLDSVNTITALLKSHENLYGRWSSGMYALIVGLCIRLLCKVHTQDTAHILPDMYSQYVTTIVSSGLLNCHSGQEVLCMVHPLLKSLECIPYSCVKEDKLSTIFVLPKVINNMVAMNDPLLLSFLCQYLVIAKERVAGLPSSNDYVKLLNRCIVDMTNYLWRNKIFAGGHTWGMNTNFWQRFVGSLYLSDVTVHHKDLFTIPNFYPFRHICEHILQEMEREHNCSISFSGSMTEKGFYSWKRNLASQEGSWLNGMNNFEELRRALVLALEDEGTYKDIPVFLRTYLKSFTQAN